MAVSRIDILNKQFSRSWRGYTPQEVELFLQEVVATLTTVNEEHARLKTYVAMLEARLAKYAHQDEALREALVVGQRVSTEMQENARQEAQLIIEKAHVKVEQLLRHGSMRLARVHEEIAAAKTCKAQLELHIRAVAEQHLAMLDSSPLGGATMEAHTKARSMSEATSHKK